MKIVNNVPIFSDQNVVLQFWKVVLGHSNVITQKLLPK